MINIYISEKKVSSRNSFSAYVPVYSHINNTLKVIKTAVQKRKKKHGRVLQK